jgi:hypothetical protein
MRRFRFSAWWSFPVIFSSTLLLGGCIIHLSTNDNQGATGGETTGQQPGGGGSGGEGALTEAQQARKDEVDRYVAQVIYKGAKVTQSVQTEEGTWSMASTGACSLLFLILSRRSPTCQPR